MSRVLFVLSLLAGWILLWGKLSLANVLSGLLLVGVLYLVVPSGRPDTGAVRVRPVALLRLVAFFVGDLVISNVVLARTVLSRRPDVSSGVIRVPIADCSPGMLAFIANLIALSPGTMAVATTEQPPAIDLHVLQLDDEDAVCRRVGRLADRAIAAFGAGGGAGPARAEP